MDTTKKLDETLLGDSISYNSLDEDNLLNLLDDIDLTKIDLVDSKEVLTIEEQLEKGLYYIARKFSDGSCIYWRVTLNEELLKMKGLDYSGEYLFDYDTKMQLNWDILNKVEIVTEDFINSLPLLDKFLNGGVKRCL